MKVIATRMIVTLHQKIVSRIENECRNVRTLPNTISNRLGLQTQERPSHTLVNACSLREHILTLESNDVPSSNNCERESQCNVLAEGRTRPGGWRIYLNHVHAEDTLLILIIKLIAGGVKS